jgi:phage major head subunit gpT-like protein
MAIVSSDMAQNVSTQYEAWFLDAFNPTQGVEDARFSKLIQEIDLPNFSGNRINLNWLGAAPQLKEWVDEKQAQGLNRYEWEIVVKRWEATIEIDLDTLVDARWNIYESRIREMAMNATRHRYNLLSDLIKNGAAALGYDGQNFFDTDHAEGDSGTQSNKLTGSGTSLDNVRTDYYAAKAALMQYKDDKGNPMWAGDFRPFIWAPATATMMSVFEQLRNGGLVTTGGVGGNTNILANQFDVVYDPKLTDANDWHMFNTEGSMKPFLFVNREPIHYEDNFGTGHPDVWSRRIGQASSVGRDNATYAMWSKACKIVNS